MKVITEQLRELLWLYSRLGISDWQAAPSSIRRRAIKCLGAEIADNDSEAAVTLGTIYNGSNKSQLRFIPMPRHPKNPGFERSFFIPVCQVRKAQVSVAFDLFLIVNGANMNCLAYRFEPAHDLPSAHNYAHVQMSRKLLKKTIEPKTLDWIPDSYPAHPLHASDPLVMFLSMATAVHGYNTGIVDVIQRIFQGASQPSRVASYTSVLRSMLT